MTAAKVGAVVVVVLVLVAALVWAQPKQTTPPVASSLTSGRYQIVNPEPEGTARNKIMLLDTATGKSWIYCTTKDEDGGVTPGWCAMFQSDRTATAK